MKKKPVESKNKRAAGAGKGTHDKERITRRPRNTSPGTPAGADLLRQSAEFEARFRVMAEATFEGIVISEQGRILDTNEQMTVMLGYQKPELIGMDIAELMPDEDHGLALPQIMAREDHIVEHRLIRKDGTAIIIEAHGKPCMINGRKARITSIRDITEQKKSEEQARRQAAILRGINEILHAAIKFRSERDLGLAILAVARQVTRSRSGVIGELRGNDFCRIAMSTQKGDTGINGGASCKKRDTVPVTGLYGRVLRDGISLLTNNPSQHPDSRPLPPGDPPVESFLGVALTRNDIISGMIAVANSETGYTQEDLEALEALAPSAAETLQRGKAERALIESEIRFRMALKNAPVSVLVQDRDFRTIWAYGGTKFNPDEIIGKTDQDLFPRDEAERLMALKRRVIETGEDIRDLGWVTMNGKKYYVDLYLEPYRDDTGQIAGVSFAAVDLTDIKNAEEAIRRHIEVLRETNEEMGKFNNTMVNRELRMIELKKQVNELCLQAGKKPPYNLDFERENE